MKVRSSHSKVGVMNWRVVVEGALVSALLISVVDQIPTWSIAVIVTATCVTVMAFVLSPIAGGIR